MYVVFFSLAHVPSANMEGAGLMTYTAASHQGANKMFWLHLDRWPSVQVGPPVGLFFGRFNVGQIHLIG